MTQFIDLDRQFREPTDEELEDVGRFGFLNSYDFQPGVFDWSKLLTYSRVILLAEAGSGKTEEMKQQQKKLVEAGKFAFFVPLESLDRDRLTECLSSEDERKFETWKSDEQEPGWFFLDAVDELKLTEGKLDRALNRLSREIDGHLHRVHVIISCRPSDWHPERDLATVLNRLPVPQERGDIHLRSSEEVFQESLKRNQHIDIFRAEEAMRNQSADTGQPEGFVSIEDGIQTVAMLPMSREQIERFVEQYGMDDPAVFLDEVFKQKAWPFARHPRDLIQLIAIWNKSKHLGTRAEQHEDNVRVRLKDDPERPDRGVLTDEKVRLGAEHLALALARTRTRTIRSLEQTPDASRRTDGVLEPTKTLPDWTAEERQTLLRRSLFDPATYGRVRFYHSSVQEYLAACRLRALRNQGMSTKAVFRLLFTEQYGVKVVFPSMRKIAAWLALWDNDVCNELLEREPETLLSLGDPETLELATRSKLVRKFVDKYGQGGWHGLHWEILREVPRLADPGLAPVIRECWGNGPKNEDVRGLLLEIILEGPIVDCSDLAHAAALDPTWHEYHRITAIRAMLACGLDDAAREIADDMLLEKSSWPNKIVRRVVEYLFPRVITADELMTLMEQRPESKAITGGFAWTSGSIAATIDPWSEPAVAFRNKMANLIWRERTPIQQFYPIHSKFDHLSEALARLCDRQLSKEPHRRPDDDLIRACVIASLFDSRGNGWRKTFESLRAHFTNNVTLRSTALWTELACVDEDMPHRNDIDRLENILANSLAVRLTEVDRPWLETAIADESRPERRGVALLAWIQIWREHGRDASELDTIRHMLKDDPALEQIFEDNTVPPGQNEGRQERLERQLAQRKRIRNDRKAQYEKWTKWRDELLENPENAFSEEKRENTVYWLFRWWCEPDLGPKYNTWNKEAITQAFNRDIADRAEQAMQEFWRTSTPPVLWSARPIEERNSTPWKWLCGLWCVYAEASTPGWTASLSPKEACIAAIYATVELNNFPSFIADLAQSHPEEVDKSIGGELSAELNITDSDDLFPILHKLTTAPDCLKQLLAHRLFTALMSQANAFLQVEWGAYHLASVLRIISETCNEEDRSKIARVCAENYTTAPVNGLALTWLRGLFRFDAERGTQALIAGLADNEDPVVRERAIGIFADLFGDHDVALFKIADPTRCADALGQLVRYAYIFIRPEEDQVHEGVYSPDTRDKAEQARDFLLSRLLNTPGPEARRVALALADENDFADRSDYIRLRVRQRTATDTEFAPYAPEDVTKLEHCLEMPLQDRGGLFNYQGLMSSSVERSPKDRDSLFSLMMNQLKNIQEDLSHDDFTDLKTVRSIDNEEEMQRTLARRIRDKAEGAYKVTREEQVADRKCTDIRLLAINNDQKAVIEVKIAHKKSLADLDKALHDQLVGQYLRASYCKAGCLLLTHHEETRSWKCPDTGVLLNFYDMVAWLNKKAEALEQEKQDIRLAVFGLDLTDPLPTPG